MSSVDPIKINKLKAKNLNIPLQLRKVVISRVFSSRFNLWDVNFGINLRVYDLRKMYIM